MKGTNMLKVNQETLVEALQRYLDAEMPGHKVRSVTHPGGGYLASGDLVPDLVVLFEPKVVDRDAEAFTAHLDKLKQQAQGGAAQ